MVPKFGLVLGVEPLEELVRIAKAAEKSNFDLICYFDHTVFWNYPEKNGFELWSILGMLAKETSRIKLSPLVTDPLRRHPSITAQATLTLDRISHGRAVLAMGSGSTINLIPFGIGWGMPVSKLKEAIEVIKALWASRPQKPVTYRGKFYRLEKAFLQLEPVQRPHPPLYLSAFGPKSRKIVGELADGFLTVGDIESPKKLEESIKEVESAAANFAGRKIEELDILVEASTAVSDDYNIARNAVEKRVRQEIAIQPLCWKGLGIKLETPEMKLISRFRSKGLAISYNKLMNAVRNTAAHIPIRLDELAIFGTVDDCIKKIEQYVKAGAKTIIVKNCGPDRQKTENYYQKKIIPYFQQA